MGKQHTAIIFLPDAKPDADTMNNTDWRRNCARYQCEILVMFEAVNDVR